MRRPGRRRRLFDARPARRAEGRAPERRAAGTRTHSGPPDWIGRDWSLRAPAPRSRRGLRAAALAAVLVAALGLVTLRTEILRARQSLAERVGEEERLRGVRDELRVALRRLRHPDRLTALARERGFGPPERVLDLGPPREAP